MSKFEYKDTFEFYQEMVELGRLGLTLEECGDYHGVLPEDWAEWCENYPVTVLSHKRGKAQGLVLAGRELLAQAAQGKINAVTFYLKTQGNFTEKSHMRLEEISKPKPVERPPTPIDPVEAAKAYKAFIQSS
jgi:hypothetical protein